MKKILFISFLALTGCSVVESPHKKITCHYDSRHYIERKISSNQELVDQQEEYVNKWAERLEADPGNDRWKKIHKQYSESFELYKGWLAKSLSEKERCQTVNFQGKNIIYLNSDDFQKERFVVQYGEDVCGTPSDFESFYARATNTEIHIHKQVSDPEYDLMAVLNRETLVLSYNPEFEFPDATCVIETDDRGDRNKI